MKTIVFGATGGTGKLVVEQLLKAGHEVTVIVRNPVRFALRGEKLEIVKGDAFQPGTFEKSVQRKRCRNLLSWCRKREPRLFIPKASKT